MHVHTMVLRAAQPSFRTLKLDRPRPPGIPPSSRQQKGLTLEEAGEAFAPCLDFLPSPGGSLGSSLHRLFFSEARSLGSMEFRLMTGPLTSGSSFPC